MASLWRPSARLSFSGGLDRGLGIASVAVCDAVHLIADTYDP
jgi:hypothetical protein